jgi:hypothetical protein
VIAGKNFIPRLLLTFKIEKRRLKLVQSELGTIKVGFYFYFCCLATRQIF